MAQSGGINAGLAIADPELFNSQLSYQAQQDALARRQALAQSLLQDSSQPLPNAAASGGVQYHTSPLEGLSRVLSGGLGAYGMQKINEDSLAAAKNYGKAIQGSFGGTSSSGAGTTPTNTPAASSQGSGGSLSSAIQGLFSPSSPSPSEAQPPVAGGSQTQDNGQQPYKPGGTPVVNGGYNLGKLDPMINDAAQRYGVNAQTMRALIGIESGGNPNAGASSSYKGLGQFNNDEWSKYGKGRNVLDPAASIDAIGAKLADQTVSFKAKYGRDPEANDLYMMHQQGEGGYANHAANPDRPAWQNMNDTAEGRQKGAGWARKAIWGNVPGDQKEKFGSVDNVTSGQFMDMWRNKMARFGAGPAQANLSARTGQPVQTDQNAAQTQDAPTGQAPLEAQGASLASGAGALPQDGASASPTASQPAVANAGRQWSIPGVPDAQARYLFAMNPEAWAKLAEGAYKPTDVMKDIQSGNFSPEMRQQIMQQRASKDAGQFDPATGTQTLRGADGSFSQSPIPGSIATKEADSQAKAYGTKLGDAANDPAVADFGARKTAGLIDPTTGKQVVNGPGGSMMQPIPGSLQTDTAIAQSKETGTKLGAAGGDYPKELNARAYAAADTLRTLSQQETLTGRNSTGSFANIKAEGGELLRSMGVPDESIRKWLKISPGDAEASNKLLIEMASQGSKNISARPTEFEFKKMIDANPGMTQTPEGLRNIFLHLKGIANDTLDEQKAFLGAKKAGLKPEEYADFPAIYNQQRAELIRSGAYNSPPNSAKPTAVSGTQSASPSSASAVPAAPATRTIGGKTYVNIGGTWHVEQ